MASNSLKSSEGKQVAAIGLPSIDHGSMEYGLDLERAGLSGRPRRSSCTIWPSMLLVLEVDRPRNGICGAGGNPFDVCGRRRRIVARNGCVGAEALCNAELFYAPS